MGHDELRQELGEIKAVLSEMNVALKGSALTGKGMRAELDEARSDIKQLMEIKSKVYGGYIVVAGIASTIGAAVAGWLLEHKP